LRGARRRNDVTAVASCDALVEVWRGNFIAAEKLADEAMQRDE
jgi:hypothetical protein